MKYILIFVLLSGCANAVVAPVKIPDELLTCKDAPSKPVEYTNAEVGEYVIGLHSSWADCHGKLGAIKRAYK